VLVTGSFSESALSGKPVEGRLSLKEAVRRGLDYNLGAVGLSNATMAAHGQMRIARSTLLPNLNGYLREAAQQTNLATLGLRSSFIPQIIRSEERRVGKECR